MLEVTLNELNDWAIIGKCLLLLTISFLQSDGRGQQDSHVEWA
jgi:hypothetical protein